MGRFDGGVITAPASTFDAAELARRRDDVRISVCLPARDEAATVGEIVSTIDTALRRRVPLVDEIVVCDDHSTDATAAVARAAGARVISAADTVASHPTGPGKGQAMWRLLAATTGDLVVWCDADVTDFSPHVVVGLVGPLLTHPEVAFVKGTYDRPLVDGVGGGRVTELVARPLLSILEPELAALGQPLGGEYAGRRRLLETLPFPVGYGVEMGLLLEIARHHGTRCIAQVDLGARRHRNRPLDELAPQALEILHVALRHRVPGLVGPTAHLVGPDGSRPVTTDELPPVATLTGGAVRAS